MRLRRAFTLKQIRIRSGQWTCLDPVWRLMYRLQNFQVFRTILRITYFILTAFGAYMAWTVVHVEFFRYEPAPRTYSADVLQLEVSSCDITVLAGDTRQVKTYGLLAGVVESAVYSELDVLSFLKTRNLKACSVEPQEECKDICRLEVEVPPDGLEKLWIWQSSDDEANHIKLNISGVVLKDLTVRGSGGNYWDSAGPSLELYMDDTVVQGSLKVTLTGGHASIQRSDFQGSVDIRGRNSVTLFDMPWGENLGVKWRQPMNMMCMTGTERQLVVPDPKGAFHLCDGDYYKNIWVDKYDKSKDGLMDMREYKEGLGDVPICCGGSCPHASWCETLLFKLFPFEGSNRDSLAQTMTNTALWDNIKEQNASGHVPLCFREALLSTPVVRARTLAGWPVATPRTEYEQASTAPVANSCLRNSDCSTDFCNSTSGACEANPVVSYALTYSWSACDRPCGGGQKVRTSSCIGDGHLYPTWVCAGLAPAMPVVQPCNTHACVTPTVAPNITLEADQDLRDDWIDITVQVQIPPDAANWTHVSLSFGTADGPVGASLVSSTQEECSSSCALRVQSPLPAYVDRLYGAGHTADGAGPRASALLVDRSALPVSSSWRVQSEAGMVRVHLRTENGNATPWWPPGKLPGVRMYIDDAKMLMEKVGPTLGDPTSLAHGIVIIHTVPSPGIPETRWIYTTRPAFLALDPAHLSLYSANIMTPDISIYRVRLHQLSCTSPLEQEVFDVGQPQTQRLLSDIYSQLEKSMRSDGWASSQRVRGHLIFVSPDTLPGGRRLYQFRESISEGSLAMEELNLKSLDDLLSWAVRLSILAGILAGGSVVFVLHKAGLQQIQGAERTKQMQRRLLARKLGDKLDLEDQQEEKTIRTPFTEPLMLIDLLAVEPLRRHLVNSLRRFTNEMCEIVPYKVRPKTAQQEVQTRTSKGETDSSKVAPLPDELRIVATVDAKLVDGKDCSSIDPPGAAPDAVKLPKRQAGVEHTVPRKEHFVYMREFRQCYEEYCIQEGLDPITSRNEIVRSLAKWFDLRVIQERVWRLKGVKWRDTPLEVKMDSYFTLPTPDEERPLLAHFMYAHCEVTRNVRNHWIDVKSRHLPSGEHVEGLFDRYTKYCLSIGEVPPSLEEYDPLNPANSYSGLSWFASDKRLPYEEITVQRIPFVTVLPTIAPGMYRLVIFTDLMEAVVDTGVLILPVLMTSPMYLAQEVYAKTLAENGLVRIDLFNVGLPLVGYLGRLDVIPFIRFIAALQIIYLLMAITSVLLNYSGTGHCLRFRSWYNNAFAVVLAVELFLFFSYAGTVLAWSVLAAILEPSRFLVYGTGVVVVFWVVIALSREMREASDKVRAKIASAVEMRMQSVLQTFKGQVEEGMYQEMIEELGASEKGTASHLRKRSFPRRKKLAKRDDTEHGFDDFHKAMKTREPVTPTDVFELLDRDRNGTLDMAEFKTLFSAVDDTMSERITEQLFAYCDTDGSQSISLLEMEDAWSYLMEKIIEESMTTLGSSTWDIIYAVTVSVLILLLLFGFIFLALQGWYTESAFDSVVQTALVAGSGKAVMVLRRRAPADGDKDLNSVISELRGSGDGSGAAGNASTQAASTTAASSEAVADGGGGGEGGEGGEGGG